MISAGSVGTFYGAPQAEPRHPDLGSGKPWPIITPATGASTDTELIAE
jgi:hypothetical protein